MSDYIGYAGFPGLEAILSPSKPSYGVDQAVAQLTRAGVKWGPAAKGTAADVTWSVAGQATGAWPDNQFTRFTEYQIRSAETALDAWGDVANIRFTRIGSGTSGEGAYSNAGQMKFEGFIRSDMGADGMAELPGHGSSTTAVWMGSETSFLRSKYQWIRDGENRNEGYATLLHEIGHAIGLSHPSDYGKPNPTYDADAGYAQDTKYYSVMSYFDGGRPGYGVNNRMSAATPEIHDIAAAQAIYGANMTTRTGDTVYGFNSNTDEGYFHIETAFATSVRFAVWDAGGNDTFDFSGWGYNRVIDLTPGSLSSVGSWAPGTTWSIIDGAQVATDYEIFNVGIAYGVTIENAIGGSGGEMIIGNDASNRLSGDAGADWIQGGSGADYIDGGDDADHLYGHSAAGGVDGNDTINGGGGHDYVQGNAGNDLIHGDDGNDRIQGGADADLIFGDAGYDAINGNKGDDRVFGGSGSDTLQGGQGNDEVSGDFDDDRLFGNLGNDTLAGNWGIDTMTGGEGGDLFVFSWDDANVDFGGRRTDVITDLGTGDHIRLASGSPSRVVQGGGFGSLEDAANHARSLNDVRAVDAVTVGGETYLFFNASGGHVEAVRLEGVSAGMIDSGLFV